MALALKTPAEVMIRCSPEVGFLPIQKPWLNEGSAFAVRCLPRALHYTFSPNSLQVAEAAPFQASVEGAKPVVVNEGGRDPTPKRTVQRSTGR